MGQKTEIYEVKVVSRVLAVGSETSRLGTVEAGYGIHQEWVRLGTLESYNAMRPEHVALGTDEILYFQRYYDETTRLGTVEQCFEVPVQASGESRLRSEIPEPQVAESQSRIRTEVRDVVVRPTDYESKLVSNALADIPGQDFRIVFLGNDTKTRIGTQVSPRVQWDAYNTIHWIGDASDYLTRFGLTYVNLLTGEELPMDASLPRTVSGAPTLTWDCQPIGEDDQNVEYRVQVSRFLSFETILYQVSGVAETSPFTAITLPDSTCSASGTYYWRVRAYDGYDWGPWSATFSFDKVGSILSERPVNPNWTNPFLLKPRSFSYLWDTRNLAAKTSDGIDIPYMVRVRRYEFQAPTCSGEPGATTTAPSVADSQEFYINHSAPNPPVFEAVVYDPQSHHVKMDVLLYDSQFRNYNLGKFEYTNAGVPSPRWIPIDDFRILGPTKGLSTDPSKRLMNILAWDPVTDYDEPYTGSQDMTYDCRLLDAPVHQNNDFWWGAARYTRYSKDYNLTQVGWGSGIDWQSVLDNPDIGKFIYSWDILTEENWREYWRLGLPFDPDYPVDNYFMHFEVQLAATSGFESVLQTWRSDISPDLFAWDCGRGLKHSGPWTQASGIQWNQPSGYLPAMTIPATSGAGWYHVSARALQSGVQVYQAHSDYDYGYWEYLDGETWVQMSASGVYSDGDDIVARRLVIPAERLARGDLSLQMRSVYVEQENFFTEWFPYPTSGIDMTVFSNPRVTMRPEVSSWPSGIQPRQLFIRVAGIDPLVDSQGQTETGRNWSQPRRIPNRTIPNRAEIPPTMTPVWSIDDGGPLSGYLALQVQIDYDDTFADPQMTYSSFDITDDCALYYDRQGLGFTAIDTWQPLTAAQASGSLWFARFSEIFNPGINYYARWRTKNYSQWHDRRRLGLTLSQDLDLDCQHLQVMAASSASGFESPLWDYASNTSREYFSYSLDSGETWLQWPSGGVVVPSGARARITPSGFDYSEDIALYLRARQVDMLPDGRYEYAPWGSGVVAANVYTYNDWSDVYSLENSYEYSALQERFDISLLSDQGMASGASLDTDFSAADVDSQGRYSHQIIMDLNTEFYVEETAVYFDPEAMPDLGISWEYSQDMETWTGIHLSRWPNNYYYSRVDRYTRYLRMTVYSSSDALPLSVLEWAAWGRPNQVLNRVSLQSLGLANDLQKVDTETTNVTLGPTSFDWTGMIDQTFPVIDPGDLIEDSVLRPFVMNPAQAYGFEFSIYRTASGAPLLYHRAGLPAGQTTYSLTSTQIYLAGVTNVVADYRDLEDCFIEFGTQDKEMLEAKIGGARFYWCVRSDDGMEKSRWSPFWAPGKPNLYRISWDVQGMGLSPGEQYRVRCLSYITGSDTRRESPVMVWSYAPNPQLDYQNRIQAATQAIERSAQRKEQELELWINHAASGTLSLSW